ncbi:MAG: hypothetical protein ACRC1P_06245 [Cellulosilyticaceae bacterium]
MRNVQIILLEIGTNIINIASDPIFVLLAILIIYMYKREVKDTKDLIYKNEVERTAIKDILRGLVVGSIVSLILTSLGICIPITKGMLILIPITVLLVFVNPKWGCFSYVIPITYAIYEVGKLLGQDLVWFDLHYNEMVVLIGVLHIIEGVLVGAYGYENSQKVPLYRERYITSGYIFRKYWPIPLLVFEYTNTQIIMVPIYAMLGYVDMTLLKNPKFKPRVMGCILSLYGMIIASLGYLTIKSAINIGIVIAIMPILHESMFLINSDKIRRIFQNK